MPHANLEERAAYHRAYRERNKARLAELSRNYREANADVLKQKKHEEYLRNVGAYKARAKAGRERNIDRIRAYRATSEYREKRNADRRAAYAANPAINKARRDAAWRRLPYWAKKYHAALYKARKKGGEIIDLKSIRSFYKQVYTQAANVCDYCHGVFPIRDIIVEHKQPYALGGCHSVTNFALSCMPCNLQKGAKPYDSWMSLGRKEDA